ncbi:UDP-xylose and UDP-N-acetylglucosamine transporter-like [Coccinella septempunctata]|uniref:UDP-xylose and UDP-N-acetylglucosamine transporter-like n=1 Tax=Coccinella septempunctata TaxID=41139 RepID=UPI001D0844C4|nr:UDP-xylose and UDP-N-acetylglucosamine transporter-like [Coccinella septempunctata]XP_044765867.1 UDP-xylose and UDP-N-acetylglucosamine transporter-like [Coccinella septempunctata]
MKGKAVYAVCMVLLGCGLNNVFLEYIIKLDPGAGHLITFLQFLFIAIQGFIFTSKCGTVPPHIPIKIYLLLVVMLFSTSVVNNWAFAFNIPVPLHMIFRAGSLIANLIMGVIVLNKKYTMDKYISVIMITLGIVICTLATGNKKPKPTCSDCDMTDSIDSSTDEDSMYFFWWMIGILLLTSALLLSARMGIYQETLYKQHGKFPSEALYYTHLFSLPGFILYGSSILEHASIANNSELIEIPLIQIGMPILWVFLLFNVITQYFCISSVYILTTECTSLTVTLVLTLRKFMSLVISIVYFKNPFTAYHWFGTFLVFMGTLIFTELISSKRLVGTKTKKN